MKATFPIPPDSDSSDLEQVLQSLERQYGIHITVHDRRGLLRDSDDLPILPGRNLHPHPYCVWGRETVPHWNSHCARDCFREAESVASRELRPFLKTCWKGVREVVVPIAREDAHLLTLFAGVFRATAAPDPQLCEQLPEHARHLYGQLPRCDDARLAEIARTLHFLGQSIVQYANDLREDAAASNRTGQISDFIRYNAHRNLRLADLAKHLCLSPSRTSHLVTCLLGDSFQNLVTRERMLRARVLLTTTDQTVAEIAAAVGIASPPYFNRLFKRTFGLPPGRFRRQLAPARPFPSSQSGAEENCGLRDQAFLAGQT